MPTYFKRFLLSIGLMTGITIWTPAIAAVDASPFTNVANLRIESIYGFIGLAQPIPSCGDRVRVDMTTAVGRATYATAMMAFSNGKTVVVRADNASTKVFGACNLYDIYVAQ